MKHQVARIHPADNVLVALLDLPIGTEVPWENGFVTTAEAIPAKHKLAPLGLSAGQPVTMYGVLVGTAREAIRPGG
ncbi:UxaA family hydrolase, partial [Hymenobacter agri]